MTTATADSPKNGAKTAITTTITHKQIQNDGVIDKMAYALQRLENVFDECKHTCTRSSARTPFNIFHWKNWDAKDAKHLL